MLFNQGTFVQVDTNRCLNQLHYGVECNHCVSHCPGQALILADRQIFLIQDQCLGCGLCFSDCPTQVFGSKQWDEPTIRTDVEEQGAAITQIFCGYHTSPYLCKEDKDKGAVQVPTCLSAISKGMWYELGLLTEIELRLDECHNCPMKTGIERMKYSLEIAMEWLEASGHTSDVTLIYTADKAKRRKKLQAVSSGLKTTSRRDLFLTLMGRKQMENSNNQDDLPRGEENKKKVMPNALPDWQKRLKDSYIKHLQEGGSAAYWPSIRVSNECVNCGMCARYCPTQALKIRIQERECTHTFTSGYCIDCRICMLSCPTRSILRDRLPNTMPFEEQPIFKAPVGKCKLCEAETITSKDDLCYWCKEEPSPDDILEDVRKKLFGKLV